MNAREIIEAEVAPLGFNAKRDDGDEIEWRYDATAKAYRFTKWWNDPYTKKRRVASNLATQFAVNKSEFVTKTAREFEDAGWVVTML